MKFRLEFPLLTTLIALAVFTSCSKKQGCTDPTATNYDASAEKTCCCEYASTFHLDMHMHPYMGSEPLLDSDIFVINGVTTKLDLLRFYVSNIRLVDADGNETPANGKYLLVVPDPDEYDIGDMPEGSYTKIRFDVGIDSLTNHSDNTQYALGDPLGAQTPTMYWDWDQGYMFLTVDGEKDTDGDGVVDTGIVQMHIGTDPYLAHIEVDYPFTADAGTDFTLHMNVLWDKFFEGVDMNASTITHSVTNIPLADQLLGNISNMFVPEE